MADLFHRAAAWLAEQQERHLSHPVRYGRGSAWVDVPARTGQTSFEQEDAAGLVLVVQSRDFLVPTRLLVLNDTRIEPQPGDQIQETDSDTGATFTFAVMSLAKQPCWRWSDAYRITRRIHTKQVS